MRTDSTRFIRNESSAASTFSGWKNTSCISIPAGIRSFSSRSSVRSTWRPILVISVPLSAEMEMPSALRPSYRRLVADRIFIPFGNGGDVAEPQLVVLMSLQQQAADVLRRAVTVVHGYAQPGTAAFVVSGVHGFVLSVQGGEDLCRMYPEVGEFVFVELYVDALRPLAVDVHLRDAFDFHHLLFHEFGIPCGLCVGIAVEGHGVEHAEYVAEIVHYHGYGGSFGQAPPVRRPLCGGECPSTVPSLRS